MEIFLNILSLLLFIAVAGTIFSERAASRKEWQQEYDRRNEIVELRQRYVGKRPTEPYAWEMLGDAYKQGEFIQEALDAWNEALRLNDGRIDQLSGDIGQKIRLAEIALREYADPASLQQTVATREQVCRKCGSLSPPDARECLNCGAPMLVDGMFDVAKHPILRAEVWQQVRPIVSKAAAISLGTLLATWLPMEVRAPLAIATIIVVPFWWLRRYGQG